VIQRLRTGAIPRHSVLAGTEQEGHRSGSTWFSLSTTLADVVSHGRTTLPHRLSSPFGGVFGGLVLDLGIYLGADKDNGRREPHPDHEAYDGTQRTVAL
jgi:hypothetical protein